MRTEKEVGETAPVNAKVGQNAGHVTSSRDDQAQFYNASISSRAMGGTESSTSHPFSTVLQVLEKTITLALKITSVERPTGGSADGLKHQLIESIRGT